MKKITLCLTVCFLLLLTGCESQEKKDLALLDSAQKTVLSDCGGKTLADLANDFLDSPEWSLEKSDPKTATHITLTGVLVESKLPAWVKEQKLMDVTFSFPLDAQTGTADVSSLSGAPSLSWPDGALQAYKILVCQ